MKKDKFFSRLLSEERVRKKIRQSELALYLCCEKTISKIENGDMEPGYFLLGALLERLGVSIDKFQMLLSAEEYAVIETKEQIEKTLEAGNFKEVPSLLREYQKQICEDAILKKQYTAKINAILHVSETGEYHEGIVTLQKAILLTAVICFKTALISSYLSLEDRRLLLLLANWYFKSGLLEKSKKLLQVLLQYMESFPSDEEDTVKVFPAAVYLLGKIAFLEGEEQRAEVFCEQGIFCLTKSGRHSWLLELLQLEVAIKERRGDWSDFYQKQKQRCNTLMEVYKEFGNLETSAASLIRTKVQHEIWLNFEVIRNTRLQRKLSQAAVAEQICDPVSISRIETGKQVPSYKILQKLTEKLNLKGSRYFCSIDTTEFELHKKRWELDRRLSLNQYEEARTLYNELEKRLEKTSHRNQQYLLFVDTFLKKERKEISIEEGITRYQKAYFFTAPQNKNMEVFLEVLTKQESYILNQIVQLFKEKKEYEKARILAENILSVHRKSGVSLKYYYRVLSVVMLSLGGILEECEKYQEAKDLYKEGLFLLLENEHGGLVARFLAEYAYTLKREYEKSKLSEKKEAYKKYALQALDFCELFHDRELFFVIDKELNL